MTTIYIWKKKWYFKQYNIIYFKIYIQHFWHHCVALIFAHNSTRLVASILYTWLAQPSPSVARLDISLNFPIIYPLFSIFFILLYNMTNNYLVCVFFSLWILFLVCFIVYIYFSFRLLAEFSTLKIIIISNFPLVFLFNFWKCFIYASRHYLTTPHPYGPYRDFIFIWWTMKFWICIIKFWCGCV